MESQTTAPTLAKKGTFPAKVIQSLNNDTCLVINKGSEDEIRTGQRVLVYTVGNEEILDPVTGESLGYLEIVKGTGRVIHIQPKMSTIESDKQKSYTRKLVSPYSYALQQEVIEESRIIPFDNPQPGDLVKPI
jgi:hypothetical protein